MELNEFIEWYEGAYSRGHLNASNYRESAAYLEGYGAADKNEEFERIAMLLKGSANIIDCINRKIK